VFTVLKLLALAALVGVGLLAGLPPSEPSPVGVPSAVGAALVPVLFTYGGWQQTNFIAEEMVNPERDLPRALLLGVAIVVATYLLANLAYLQILGPGGLAASTAPAADAMREVLGPSGSALISAGIAVSTFGFLNLVVLVTPRVFQAMAADGVFFPRLAQLHPVHRTPSAAIMLQAAWASTLALTGSFSQLVDYVAFADWVFFGLTVAGLFVYRARDRSDGPHTPPGAFRVPGYPWTPAAFVAAAIFVVVSSVVAAPRNAIVGTGLLALGIPVFWYWSRRKRA
jgi:APA family basic amino acid/polyamine antiporter